MAVSDRGISTDTQTTSMHVFATASTRQMAYNYYIVAVFGIVSMLSFLDRVLISMLIEPIKLEFALSDTQIGMLIGFGFILFYSVLGVPIGAIADRSNRRNLLLVGLIVWSAATSLGGFASGFAMLIAFRALVGVGEATLQPCAYTTFADRFSPARLASAIAIYGTSTAMGAGLAMMFGGLLAEWTKSIAITLPLVGQLGGWRLSMFLVGLLGIPVALLMALTVKEAPRKDRASSPPIRDVWQYMIDRPRAMFGTIMAFSFANISNYVLFLWTPALFMRVHGFDARTTGMALGGITAVVGTIGMLGSGFIVDRLARTGLKDASITVIFWALALQLLIVPFVFVVGNPTLAMALLIPVMLLATASSCVQPTAMQLLTPPRMRGRVIAILLAILNIIGIGVGPLLIGILSDHVFVDAKGLGPSMAVVSTVGVALALVTLAAVRSAARATMTELSSTNMS